MLLIVVLCYSYFYLGIENYYLLISRKLYREDTDFSTFASVSIYVRILRLFFFKFVLLTMRVCDG